QARQLEQQVTCRLALPHCTGEPARAARARDLHLVREPFVGTYEERTRQGLEADTGADDAVRVTPLHELPLALVVGHDCVPERVEGGATCPVRKDEPALPGRQARLVDGVEEVQQGDVRIA